MVSKRGRQFGFYGPIKEQNGTGGQRRGGGVGGRVYVCLCRRTRSRTHGFLLTDAEQRAESWERYGVRKSKRCGLINLPRGVEGGSGETVGRR